MPEVGKTYRLKLGVDGMEPTSGRRTDLVAGLRGTVIAIVKASEAGAGDHEHDCAVVAFENGRTWSHPIEPVEVSISLSQGRRALGFDDLFEEES